MALATDAFGVRSALENAFSAATFVGQQVDSIVGFVNGIAGRVQTGIQAIANVGAAIGDAIIDGLRDALNAGIRAINAAIPNDSQLGGRPGPRPAAY